MLIFAKMLIKQHLKRSYVIIMGIACSVTMMFCMIQMGDSINNKYKEQALGTNRYDFHVEGLTKEQADWLKGEFDKEEIEASGIFYSDYCEMQMRPETLRKIEFQVCAGTKEGLEEPGLRLCEGRWCESQDEIVLEQYVCDILGSRIGDEIRVVCDSEKTSYSLRLVGIIENTPVLLSSDWTRGFLCVSLEFLYDTGLVLPEAEVHNLIVTVDSDVDAYDVETIYALETKARELLAEIYGMNYYDAIQKGMAGQNSEEEAEILRRIGRSVGTNHTKEENILEYGSQSEIGIALKAFAILIAVAMVLLIFNSMHLTIVENTRELGMLRCIGMDYKQTGLLIFAENFFYCITGYGIGMLFGNIVNQVFAKNILYYLTGEPVKIRQLLSSYLLTAAVVLASLVLAFVLSIHKMVALTPVEASKYTGAVIQNKKVRTMEKWSAIKFAGRNIRRERSKSIIVMLSMIFSMMILMLIVNTFGSVKLPEKDKKADFSDYEVYVPVTGIMDAMEGISPARIALSEIEEVKNVQGVEKCYAIGMSLDKEEVMLDTNGNRIPNIIYNDDLFRWLLEENGKSALWEEGVDSVCVITGEFGQEDHKILAEIEETGAVAYGFKDGREGVINVDTVLRVDYRPECKGMGGEPLVLVMTEKCASEVYAKYCYVDLMVRCDADFNEEVYDTIAGIFADNAYALGGSYEVGMEPVIRNALSILYIAALIVIATLTAAVLNMMIIMKANLVLRRKEHGIWRALGMPLGELKKTLRIEILLLLSASCGMAVLLSFPIQWYLCDIIGNRNMAGIVGGYLGVGIVSVFSVYLLVMSGLKFRDTNQIIADIREES